MRLLEEIILLGACSNGLGTFESQDGSAPAPPQMPNFGGGPPGAPAVIGGFGGGMLRGIYLLPNSSEIP